jgi:hypothetical protein
MTKKVPNAKGACTIRFGSPEKLAALVGAHSKIDAPRQAKGERKQSFNSFVVEAVEEHIKSKKA